MLEWGFFFSGLQALQVRQNEIASDLLTSEAERLTKDLFNHFYIFQLRQIYKYMCRTLIFPLGAIFGYIGWVFRGERFNRMST